jgi:hypothetical protein
MGKFLLRKFLRMVSSLSRRHSYLFSVLSFVVDSMQNVEQTQICTINVPTRYRCDLNVPDISPNKCKNEVKVLPTYHQKF